ncbi:MAG: Rieske 2Fe-2S domain-containing protein [Pseudomonadota bacterium]|nr:Rieske 2Fe-2S domain-containing protein [Pseudomonadota bacterium]
MLTAEENELLTQSGAGTPMGQYFRRFWQPVALTEELPELDGAPIRVTVLGEDLVAFRDSSGMIGLIDRYCPHRGADLFYGRNEECGLRCVYHGWKFDREGKALELPNVPPSVRMQDTMRIKAYPTREYGGLVWAYLGPRNGDLPEVPKLEFGLVSKKKRYAIKQRIECNWVQIMEGDLDTSHFSFLHMPAPIVNATENRDANSPNRHLEWMRRDGQPKFDLLDHDVGFVAGGARATDDEGELYWRMTQFMLPSHGTGPATVPGETYYGFTLVPTTDTGCWMYCYAWNPERNLEDAELAKIKEGHGIFAEVGPDFMPVRNRSNDYDIDREVQKHQTYTGVKGTAEQDIMIQQSQGWIADRTRENLTATDAAIVHFRRLLIGQARALAEKGEEPSAAHNAAAFCTRPGAWVTNSDKELEAVLTERFGHPRGLITS